MNTPQHKDTSEAERSDCAGFVLAGLQGSSGKTVLACLLLAAFEKRGHAVQPFKAGPDYIDPGYHNLYATRASRNLDAWLMGKDRVLQEASQHTTQATGVLEGVLGLFDGAHPTSDDGSTMELARWLDWPVVLSVPAAKAGRSLAAGLRGFLAEAGPGRIAGVVLMGVSGDSHTAYLREALSPLGIPVLGAVPRMDALEWPERHLGLQASQERHPPSREELAAIANSTLDLDAFENLARIHSSTGRPVPVHLPSEVPSQTAHTQVTAPPEGGRRHRVGIARDAVFHFYYEANLDWLLARGMELVSFSPLLDESLPSGVDSIVLGGGFPEVAAAGLSQNTALLRSIREAVIDGLPCYAECGGLMLLSEAIVTLEGGRFPMAGVVPGSVEMTRSLQNFGYCAVAQGRDTAAHGHEFHHSRWTGEGALANAWEAVHRRTGRRRREGFRHKNLHASYVHLYFPALPPTLASNLFPSP